MTTVEQEMRQFLAQPENIRTAMEIARHVEKMRNDAHAAFWRKFEDLLRKRVADSSYNSSWYLTTSDKNFQNAWFNNSIAPQLRMTHPSAVLLKVALEQNSLGNGYRLYYGIKWTHNRDHRTELPEYKALRSYLLGEGYKLTEREWWMLSKGTGYAARGDSFLYRMAQEPEAFSQEMVDLCWHLFGEAVELMNAFNSAAVEAKVRDGSRSK